MTAISFLLTPLIPLLLAIYNFARPHRTQGLLYLGVIGVHILLIALMTIRC